MHSQTCSLDEPTLELSFKLSKYPEAKTLGEGILNYRLRQNLKQKELAKILGVSKTTIGNWELDQRKPSPDLNDRLIQYLVS
jgi:DNA-binding XRE family transcriptional regulator